MSGTVTLENKWPVLGLSGVPSGKVAKPVLASGLSPSPGEHAGAVGHRAGGRVGPKGGDTHRCLGALLDALPDVAGEFGRCLPGVYRVEADVGDCSGVLRGQHGDRAL